MAPPVQTVVYRLNPAYDPAWQFYSMPESIVGAVKRWAKRAEYRDALAFSLAAATLLEVREHIEREVIVAAPVDLPLSSILGQMTVYDSLILVALYRAPGEVQNVWLSLAGAETDTDEPPTSFEELGRTVDSPLRDLLGAALERQVTRVGALALC